MTNFIEEQQKHDDANALNLIDYKNYEVDYISTQENIDLYIKQTITNTLNHILESGLLDGAVLKLKDSQSTLDQKLGHNQAVKAIREFISKLK